MSSIYSRKVIIGESEGIMTTRFRPCGFSVRVVWMETQIRIFGIKVYAKNVPLTVKTESDQYEIA